ncbi:hypothetical protein [Bradyrhizobium sp. DASA03120]|uniref:hypothetical protein n=1 Tax=Bradyrhizobium sp. SMVTL-02 TaxID=3395917 RepID=UPI003F72B0EA
MTEQLEAQLADLRGRADILTNRHRSAEAALGDAKAKLQHHHLEADLDTDDKGRVRLETAVAACAVARDGYVDALAEVQAKLGQVEQKLAAERATAERKAASKNLARDLDAVERALPEYLHAGRSLAGALEAIDHNFEAAQIATFIHNGQAQVEIAAAFVVQELRNMVGAIRDGAAPIPTAKPDGRSAPAPEPAPPTMTVFMLRSARYLDGDGRKRFAGQWEDATLPVATAQRALRLGVAVAVTDPRRAQLRGARGGDFNPKAPDVVDLDTVDDEPKPVSHVDPVLRDANFTVIDRSAEARTLQIEVPRL